MNNVKHTLEFDIVLEQIAAFASFSLGKQAVLDTEPSYSKLIVNRQLAQMSDALKLVSEEGSFGLSGLSDIRPIVNHAAKSATLLP